jgi:hypothetical protein
VKSSIEATVHAGRATLARKTCTTCYGGDVTTNTQAGSICAPPRGESGSTEVLEHLRHEQEPRREQGGDAKTNDN